MFSDMLTQAILDAEQADMESSAHTDALLAGETDDIAAVMIAGSKAELSLNLVVQVRNKVIDAYNQIMQMQV